MMSETGETLGPYPYSNLHAWYTSEQLAGEQLVARAGMADWVELSTIIIDDELHLKISWVEFGTLIMQTCEQIVNVSFDSQQSVQVFLPVHLSGFGLSTLFSLFSFWPSSKRS